MTQWLRGNPVEKKRDSPAVLKLSVQANSELTERLSGAQGSKSCDQTGG